MPGLVEDVRTVARGWQWTHRTLVPRSAEPYQPDRARREFPTGWARGRVARGVRESIIRLGLDPLLGAELRREVHGLDVLDRLHPPVIFVANHASHLDTPLLLTALPDAWRRRTTVAAAADYFFDTWWRAVGSALVFNTFPIERRAGGLAATPGRVLDEGWNVVVFPEGTRSRDGWMGPMRLGAVHLAARHGVPVVPVALRGTFAAMPRGRGWPAPGRPPVRVRFGPAVHPGQGESTRALGARVAGALARLLDEDANTWWEAARRASAGGSPPLSGPDVARWRRLWETTTPPVDQQQRPIWRSVER